MKNLILSFAALLITAVTIGQITEIQQLDEVLVSAVNYKYLSAVDNQEVPIPIKEVERQVATYDITESEMYQDEYDQYTVAFFIPDGRVVAAYDKNGKVLRTIEKFTNYQLPENVMKALKERFPNWKVVKDVYRVSYHHKKGEATRRYKIKLKNKDKIVRVKMDEKGNFI